MNDSKNIESVLKEKELNYNLLSSILKKVLVVKVHNDCWEIDSSVLDFSNKLSDKELSLLIKFFFIQEFNLNVIVHKKSKEGIINIYYNNFFINFIFPVIILIFFTLLLIFIQI